MRQSNSKVDIVKVDIQHFTVFRVFVRSIDLVIALYESLGICSGDVLQCIVVDREDTVLRAALDRHVADCKPTVHGQSLNAFAVKFQRLIERTVDTDLTDDV